MQWYIEHSLSIHSKADGCYVVGFFSFPFFSFSFQSDSEQTAFPNPSWDVFVQFPALLRIKAVINKGEEDFNKQGQHTV